MTTGVNQCRMFFVPSKLQVQLIFSSLDLSCILLYWLVLAVRGSEVAVHVFLLQLNQRVGS